MSKVYLRAVGVRTFEWVDKVEDATEESKESTDVTLKQLKAAKLERAPKKTPVQDPGWVISSEG